MFSLIPLDLYHDVFKLVTLLTITLVFVLCFAQRSSQALHSDVIGNEIQIIGTIYAFSIFMLLAFRPISYVFGDMGNYYKHFLNYVYGQPLSDGDIIFELLMQFNATYLTPQIFFFICFVVHFIPIIVASKRLVGQLWVLAFLFTIANYDYYGYAVNGIRQGISASLFLLAITFKGWVSLFIMLLAIGFHKSYILPMVAWYLCYLNRNPKQYLSVWFLCLLITSVYSGFSDLVSSLGLFSDDLSRYNYADDNFKQQFSASGFRIDFVVYSLLPILVAGYFIFIRKITTDFYTRLFCCYLTCNAFWLLMMHMPASNRIAFISWFLAGFIITYPFVKFQEYNNQNKIFASILLVFYLFTFVAN